MRELSFAATVGRLSTLADAREGALAAADIEEDEPLMRSRNTTSAAARMLASGSDVVAEPSTDSAHWFPYARLTFTSISSDAARHE